MQRKNAREVREPIRGLVDVGSVDGVREFYKDG